MFGRFFYFDRIVTQDEFQLQNVYFSLLFTSTTTLQRQSQSFFFDGAL